MLYDHTVKFNADAAADDLSGIFGKVSSTKRGGPPRQGIIHGEAFCLMNYRCDYNHVEVLWNSRDGVTPFIIGCRVCGGPAQHISWNLDQFVPDYRPPVGMRIFVDMTEEEAKAALPRFMAQFDGTEHEVHGEERGRVERELLEDWIGSPTVRMVKDGPEHGVFPPGSSVVVRREGR